MAWTATELQKLVLMVGSKKEFATYLGLDPKQADELWTRHGLQKPLVWLRAQPLIEQLQLLAKAGSLKELAKRLACSEASLRPIFMGPPSPPLNWSLETFTEKIERYGSVRLVAHMNDTTESAVRKEADRWELDLASCTDYSGNNYSNGKGRRAELEYAALRGERIFEDRNKTQGPQASYDFYDLDHGRVNVKSSRQYRFKAQTRRENPDFWKFSTRGHDAADLFVCMCYDFKMEKLVGVHKVNPVSVATTATVTLRREQLESPDVLKVST